MAKLLFANNAVTTLAGNVLAADTTVTVASGTGDDFPSPGANEYFVCQFTDTATGNLYEIVNVTARVGDVFTVVRGQEGTTALNWLSGDIFANTWTAGQAEAMLQQGESQAQGGNYGVDSGTADAYYVALSPAVTTYTAGLPVRVKISNTSTGASTLNAGGGVKAIKHPDGTDIAAGDLVAGGVYEFVYDGTRFNLTSLIYPLSNAGLAAMPTARFMGRTSAGTGKPEYLTAAQATALLNAVAGDEGTGGTKGLVPAPGAGSAAAGNVLLASGAFGQADLSKQTISTGTSATNGYYRIGNIIEAWGEVNGTYSSDGPETFSFGVTFATCFNVIAWGVGNGTSGNDIFVQYRSHTNTGCTLYVQRGSGATGDLLGWKWRAVGTAT